MILKPKRLKYGDAVALIAPSGIVREEKFKKAVRNFNEIGFLPISLNNELKNYGYLADTDENRLIELMLFFQNDVLAEGIFCIRGGYGATRILDQINYDIVCQNPKVFVGFSDITALQSAFFVKTGLVTFHGIVAASEFTEYVLEQINDLIVNPVENYVLPARNMKILNEGKAEGKIVGGNLSLLTSLIGTEYLYSFQNNIVFIEEIAETPYKIDRMLNHLLMATDLKKASAIVFGKFHRCEAEHHDSLPEESFTIEEIIKQYFSDFKIPVVYNINFGHIKDGLIFPIGINASIDTEFFEIRLLETAVLK
ncbi:MAG: LD-carboxypeptidase [Bacteroidales bacterium]|nr:LD-carboxypeptidase [Bacteroidales bacterium]